MTRAIGGILAIGGTIACGTIIFHNDAAAGWLLLLVFAAVIVAGLELVFRPRATRRREPARAQLRVQDAYLFRVGDTVEDGSYTVVGVDRETSTLYLEPTPADQQPRDRATEWGRVDGS